MFTLIDKLLHPLTEWQQYAIKHNCEIVPNQGDYYLLYNGDLVGTFRSEFKAAQFINSRKFTK